VTDDEVKAVAKAVSKEMKGVAGGCNECCRTCELDPNMHRDDHKFIYELRQTLADSRKTFVVTFCKILATAVVMGLVALLVIKVGSK